MMNIILTGFMGTGKSTVGRRLARRLGWTFVDVDRLIEISARMPIARIFAERGEVVFRRLERRAIGRVIRGHEQVIATGGGAFVDPQSRAALRVSGPVVCLTARPQVILARVGRRLNARPLLAGLPALPAAAPVCRPGDGTGRRQQAGAPRSPAGGRGLPAGRQAQAGRPSPLGRIRTLLAKRAAAYAHADLTMDTSSLSPDDIVERIWAKLSPCLCKSWRYFLDHVGELSERYGGKYVVVVDDRIVGSGETQLAAYQHAAPRLARKDAGIYYLPLPEESLTAL